MLKQKQENASAGLKMASNAIFPTKQQTKIYNGSDVRQRQNS